MQFTVAHEANASKTNRNGHSDLASDPEIRKRLDLLTLEEAETAQAGDDYLIKIPNIQNKSEQCLLGVLDGHGINGHRHSFTLAHLISRQLIIKFTYLLPINPTWY